jgi:hypothetical protein
MKTQEIEIDRVRHPGGVAHTKIGSQVHVVTTCHLALAMDHHGQVPYATRTRVGDHLVKTAWSYSSPREQHARAVKEAQKNWTVWSMTGGLEGPHRPSWRQITSQRGLGRAWREALELDPNVGERIGVAPAGKGEPTYRSVSWVPGHMHTGGMLPE